MDITFVIMFCVAMVAGEQQGDNTGDVFLLYTHVFKKTVGTMSLDGSHREHCLPSKTFRYPRGIIYDQNSNTVYMLDMLVSVYKFTLDGQSAPELIYKDTSADLLALALDGEGHMFITDYTNHKITRININGTDPVDWVTGVRKSYGVVVDTAERHLIWSDVYAKTISRTSLDDPLSTVTVIIQNTFYTTGLHMDTALGKLFWCEYTGGVLTANTDGSDVEVIVYIAKQILYDITGYGGHLYVTGTRSPYTVNDIYNGSYTAIFNSTTSRLWGITVVNNHIRATVCKVNCYNGGKLVEANRICDCVHPWTGRECTVCDITCQNGGTLEADTCTCDCSTQWSGDQCENCNIQCQNGGTLDVNTCTCGCLPEWIGDRCNNCDKTCQNGGTLDVDTCTCDCLPQWSGDTCENCIIRCQNGGTLDVNTCTCNCLPKWRGDRCHTCDITCQNGGTLKADTCACDCSTQWSGDQCETCDITCQNGGTLDADTCTCDCSTQWTGDQCENCNIQCENGGTLDVNTCTCDCLPEWIGDRCNNCNLDCQNGGTIDEDACTCDCLPQWSGDQCGSCGINCQNGGTLDSDTCACDCLQQWSGDQCENCNVMCQNGGTLDVDSCTCDCLQEWSGDQCENCDMICQNGGTLDSDICTCDCLPQWSGDECEIPQRPIPSRNSPEITSSSPSFGPAAGGTWITVTGTNFPLEYNMSITIADTTCDTKLQNTTTVIGITRDLHKSDIDIIGTPLPVSLNANSTVIINSSYEFTYKTNPVIGKVFPKESIIKGGTLLTVDGDYLDSVAVIWMEVIMVLKTLKSDEPLAYDETRTTYATKCQVASKTRMYCPTPILDIPQSFLDQLPQFTQTKRDVYHRTKLRRKNKERRLDIFSSLSENPSRRMKRETVKLEFSKDGDILEFYIGFRLDGVRDYENYTTIDIYTEPTFDFQSSTAMIFKAGERLSFNGEGLDIGITSYDYRITIGLEDCEDLELVSNSLSCYPPQSKPEMDENEDDKGDPQVIIHVGLNLQHLAGYLHYPDPGRAATDTKLPLHIIIPATVVPAIVVIIVIAAVCATQRRRGCCQRQE